MMLSDNPDTATAGFFAALVAGPVMFVMIASTMWLPSSVGILISEAFAIRTWIFHALNGAISGWIGWQMFSPIDQSGMAMNETTFIFGAGIAGGFAYWAVAGWSAGFWKPVFRRPFCPGRGDADPGPRFSFMLTNNRGPGSAAHHSMLRCARDTASIRPREQKPDGERAHQSGKQIIDGAHHARRAADRGVKRSARMISAKQIGMPSAMK